MTGINHIFDRKKRFDKIYFKKFNIGPVTTKIRAT